MATHHLKKPMPESDKAHLEQLVTNCVACLRGEDGETMAAVGTMLIQRIALRLNRPNIMSDAAVGLFLAAKVAADECNGQ